MSGRAKLTLLYLPVALLAVGLVLWWARGHQREAREEAVRGRVEALMTAIRPQLAQYYPDEPKQLQRKLDQWARDTDSHVMILGEEGEILFESGPTAEEIVHFRMFSEAEPPRRSARRVREAAGTGEGPGLLVGERELVPAKRGSPTMVVMVESSAEWKEVDFWQAALVGGALLGVAFILLSGWAAEAIQRQVGRMWEAVHAMAEGETKARMRVAELPEELRSLAFHGNEDLAAVEGMLREARRETERYYAVLEQMSDGVVVVDSEEQIQLVNGVFAEIFGLDAAATQGKHLDGVALNYELSLLLTRAMEQGTVQRGDIRLVRPSSRHLYGVATPLVDESKQPLGAVGLLRDTTEMARLDQVRRDFVANASHELRTPAAGIRALAEALEAGAGQDRERAQRFLEQIVAQADRLTRILDDMLILTRVERGRELLAPQRLGATAVVREALEHVGPNAMRREIELVGREAPGEVYADAGAIQTVLTNLLDNAVKYTPEGGQVVVSGREVPGGYELRVEDTGPGIPEEHQGRIFERFYRVDKARDRATGGTGLGLSIVKHIVEAHGGKVTVRSEAGAGATFCVYFPWPKGAAAAERAEADDEV